MPEELALLESPEEGIRVLRLNRPERLNALTYPLIDEIYERLAELREDEDCRVLILTGAGRGFCAGSDIDAAVGRESVGVRAKFGRQESFAGMAQTVRSLRQPVIAAVNGPVAGAGFGLAAACDLRLAASTAVFHVAAVKIGLSGGECGLSWLLPRLIGTAKAFEVLLTGRPIDAEEADRLGLVARTVADDQLLESSLEMARAIIANSPFGVELTKKAIWRSLDLTYDAAIDLENRTQIMVNQTDDCREAFRAFSERREPSFRGT